MGPIEAKSRTDADRVASAYRVSLRAMKADPDIFVTLGVLHAIRDIFMDQAGARATYDTFQTMADEIVAEANRWDGWPASNEGGC